MEQLPGQFAGVLGDDGTPMVPCWTTCTRSPRWSCTRVCYDLSAPTRGLHFVVTTRRDPPWPLHPGFVDRFSGDDHAVAAYLVSEVIDTLTPELLDFLVRVSFVDIVSADLADALTGASNGAATLAELARSNLSCRPSARAVSGTGCTG